MLGSDRSVQPMMTFTQRTTEIINLLSSDSEPDTLPPAYSQSHTIVQASQPVKVSEIIELLSSSPVNTQVSVIPASQTTVAQPQPVKKQAPKKRKANPDKEREKEAKKAEKDREKALKRANSLTIDKNKNVTEMMVHIDARIPVQKLEEIKVQMIEVGSKVEVLEQQMQTITWSRKVSRAWDQTSGRFIPCSEYSYEDKIVCRVMSGLDLAKLVAANMLERELKALQQSTKSLVILLIYDLDRFYERQRTEVRKHFEASKEYSAFPKQLDKAYTVKKEACDRALLEAQLVLGIRAITVLKSELVGEWILTLTREIASGPDMIIKNRHADVNISVEDQHGTGADVADTWYKMLQSIHGVTAQVAQGIVKQYPTLMDLYRVCMQISSLSQAREFLGNVVISRSADPMNPQGKRLGPEIGGKLWTMMTSDDSQQQFR